MYIACSLHLATLDCTHGLDRHTSCMVPAGFGAYLLGHILCLQPAPVGTHIASSHGIAIVLHCQEAQSLPETKGHDHGGSATLASESVVGINPHLSQGPGYPSALRPRQPCDPSFSDCEQGQAQGHLWHICRHAPSTDKMCSYVGSLPQSPAGTFEIAPAIRKPEITTNTRAGQLSERQ